MIICVCSKCKFTDLLNNENEKVCFRCGGRFVSTGYTSDKWINLTTEEMTKIISDKYNEYNPPVTAYSQAILDTPVKQDAEVVKTPSPAPVQEPKIAVLSQPAATADKSDDFDIPSENNAAAFTDNNAAAVTSTNTVSQESPSEVSSLSIVAFVLSFIGCLSLVSLILGIIDLAKSKGRKKGLSIAAVVISSVFILGSIAFAVLEALAVTSVIPFITDFIGNLGANAYGYDSYYDPSEFYEDDFEDDEYIDKYADFSYEEEVADDFSEVVPDTTYEEIYYDYSDKLQDEYMTASSELEDLITSGASFDELDTCYMQKLESIGNLYSSCQEEMSALFTLQPATEDDYNNWVMSLEDLYMQLSDNLEVIYRSGFESEDSDDMIDENSPEYEESLGSSITGRRSNFESYEDTDDSSNYNPNDEYYYDEYNNYDDVIYEEL